MAENDLEQQTGQIARALSGKPPGYKKLVEGLEAMKRHADEKHIPERQMWEAIHSVFGGEEAVDRTL